MCLGFESPKSAQGAKLGQSPCFAQVPSTFFKLAQVHAYLALQLKKMEKESGCWDVKLRKLQG